MGVGVGVGVGVFVRTFFIDDDIPGEKGGRGGSGSGTAAAAWQPLGRPRH
jgi:hypothetical protein